VATRQCSREPEFRGRGRREGGTGREAGPRRFARGYYVGQARECPGDEHRDRREGELERKAHEKDRLQSGSPRDHPRLQSPLQVLLEGEAAEGEDAERPPRDGMGAPAARPQEEPAGGEHDARGHERRSVLEVGVAGRREQVGALMAVGSDELVGDRVGGEPSQNSEWEAEKQGGPCSLHQPDLGTIHESPIPYWGMLDGSLNRVAASATTHCLTGCAIGEVLGLAIATALDWRNLPSILLAIGLAFLFGYSFTMVPLLRTGIALGTAVGLALAADTISIAVMEVVDNAIVLVVPGAMDAGLADLLFWGSLAFALAVAWVAAFPVNRWLIARGRGHAVVHAHH
jgi:hypothetical protein